MSSLIKSLKASMAAAKPRTLGKDQKINMLAEVVQYKESTIVVKALNGVLEGQTVEVGMPKKNKKFKISNLTTASKNQTSMFTEVGGILRLDGVSRAEHGDVLDVGWINTFVKSPSDAVKVVTEAQVQVNMTENKTAKGFPDWRLHNLDAAKETKVGTFDELKEAVADALESHRGALVVDISGGFASATPYLPGKKNEDGEYTFADPAETAEKYFAHMTEADIAEFEGALAAGAVAVVPMTSLPIGGKTAEEIQNALDDAAENGTAPRIQTINTEAYKLPSLGARLVNALARKDRERKPVLPAEYAERLSSAFLDTAGEEAKADFNKGGWGNVADVDLRKFFATRGIELNDTPAVGWNMAGIHTQSFDGGSAFFVTKTYELQRYASPYPDLEITKDLRRAYANELVDAVKVFMDSPEVAKTAQSEAPSAAATAVAEPAAEPVSEAEALELDDMIDGLLNENNP